MRPIARRSLRTRVKNRLAAATVPVIESVEKRILFNSVTVLSSPIPQTISEGTTITLTSTANASGAVPTEQWQVATPNGSGGFNSFGNITGATNVSGSASPFTSNYTFTPTRGSSGDEYRAVWTVTGNATVGNSGNATVIVNGAPIAQWIFNQTLTAPLSGDTTPGPTNGNSPTPSLQITGANDTLQVNGMNNLYYGTFQSLPESDVLAQFGTLNPHYSEFIQRIRGGGGTSTAPNGGRPDGWSQLAPQYTQGVQYSIDTKGYSNITLHFDWAQGGVADMQPQYLAGNGTWVNIGSVITTTSGDFVGAQAGGAPTGINLTLPNNSDVLNQQSLQVRLAAAYHSSSGNASLPSIVDGNTFDDGTNGNATTLHGQYAAGGTPGSQNAEQLLQIPDTEVDNVSFTYNGVTSTTLANLIPGNGVQTVAAQTATSIQAALNSIPALHGNVTVTESDNDNTGTEYFVTFNAGLKATNITNLITTSAYTNWVALGVQPAPTVGNPNPTYTLTVHDSTGNYTTAAIAYNAPATGTNSVQSALTALAASGASSFTVGTAHAFSGFIGFAVNLSSDANGASIVSNNSANSANLVAPSNFAVVGPSQFMQVGGAAAAKLLPTIFDGLVTGVSNGNQGDWKIGNVSFNGDPTNGGPGITQEPLNQTGTAGYPLTLNASAYSDATLTSVQWEYSTDGGMTFNPVPTSGLDSTGAFTSNTSGNTFTGAGPAYNSSYTFTPNASMESVSHTYQFEAVFSNGNPTASVAASIPVVALTTPVETVVPLNTSAEEGNVANFSATATGSPAPTVQWELLSGNGTFISNLNNNGASVVVNTMTSAITNNQQTTSTLAYITNANGSENGDKVVAVFTNDGGSTGNQTNQQASLTVLTPETTFTKWDFNLDPIIGSDSPAPNLGHGTASIVGMNLAANSNDGASGYVSGSVQPFGALANGDITNAAGVQNSNFSENDFRARSGVTQTVVPTHVAMLSPGVATVTIGTLAASEITPFSPIFVSGISADNGEFNSPAYPANVDQNGDPVTFTITNVNGAAGTISYNVPYSDTFAGADTNGVGNVYAEDIVGGPYGISANGGAPGNGWSVYAPGFSQGAQFSSSTQGYNHVYVTMDWYGTTSSVLDAQPQYSTGTATASAAITQIADVTSGNTNTVTATGNNTYVAGEFATVSGLSDPTLDGTYQITAASPTSFSYVDPNYSGSSFATTAASGSSTVQWVDLGQHLQTNGNDFFGATQGSTSGAIQTLAISNNVATVVATNNFVVGQPVSMVNSFFGTVPSTSSTGAGTDGTFNGTFTITAASPSQFSFSLVHPDVAATPPLPGNKVVTATATEGGLPVPVTMDVSNIPAASNNPNFGVRLVSALNPTLNAYATASSSDASPSYWPGASGNWRIGNVQFHGIPDWLSSSSNATYYPSAPTTIAVNPADSATGPLTASVNASVATVGVPAGAGLSMPQTPFTAVIGTGANAETVTVTNVAANPITFNNAKVTAQTTSALTASSGSTTLTLYNGYGAQLPPTPFQAYLGSLSSNANPAQTPEIVTVTNVTSDTLTLIRGTNPQAWSTGSTFTTASAGYDLLTLSRGPNSHAWPSGTTFTPNPTLNVTGASTIISDPMSTAGGNIPVDPNIVGTTAAAQLLVQPLVTNSAIHLGGITLSNGAGLDMASVQGVGMGGLNGVERAQYTNNVLVLGTNSTVTQEQLVETTTGNVTTDTATLTANNNFYVGDTVQVEGADPSNDGPFNGTFTVTVATPTSFSYIVPGINGNIPSQPASQAITASDQLTAPTFSITNAPSNAITAASYIGDGQGDGTGTGPGTVTVTAPGNYTAGQAVTVRNLTTAAGALDGTYRITSGGAGTFTFSSSNLPDDSGNPVTVGTGAIATIDSSFDAENNDIVVHGGNDGTNDFAAIQAAAFAGRNAPIDPSTGLPTVGGFLDGTWTGGGLTSSAAANEAAFRGREYTALAVVQNSTLPLGAYSSWTAGSVNEPLRSDGNDSIVKYTYIGDWALDGAVDRRANTVFGAKFGRNVPLIWANGSYNEGPLNRSANTVFGSYYNHGTGGVHGNAL